MTLLMLVLTATTAWAELAPVTVGNYTFATDSDDEGEYYIVDSKDAFQKLAAYVSAGGDTSGKRFKMTSDISVSGTMVGTSNYPFCGTFDGGGSNLTYTNSMSAVDFRAPFQYVKGATIKNLRVGGKINTKGLHAGGVVGYITGGIVHITNCEISIDICSTRMGKSYHGGLVGYVLQGAILHITGCVFLGCLCTANLSTSCSGFVGNNHGTTTIKNCLYMPNANTPNIVEGKIIMKSTAITTGYTFINGVHSSISIISNCYYTKTLGTAQGMKRYNIYAGKNITVGFSGEGTVYDVSGITAYATGMKYENSLIAGASQKVSLTLGHNDPEGQSLLGYRVSSGTLSGTGNPYQLTMPKNDVTISGKWLDLSLFGTASGADGTAQHPYTITTTDGLDLLATLVNGGIDFAGKYFELGADIPYDNTENNYTPIGKSKCNFRGTFDGRGYVVSGININRPTILYQALFGWVSGGALRNITVTDATIIGESRVGAVVGYASDEYTIENCYYRNVTFGVEGARDKEGDRVRALQTLTLGSKVSTSTPVTKTIGTTDYYAEGTTVELSYSGTVLEGQQVTYTVDGELIDGNKFSMPAKDVAVEAQVGIDYAYYWGTGTDGTAAKPYVISNVGGLNLLAMRTRAGETFDGTFFELGGNINLSGYYFNGIPGNFKGTFDGRSWTIRGIDINGTEGAGFFNSIGGMVKNLNLQGKVTISGGTDLNYACVGGIALSVESGGSIVDCQSLLTLKGGLYAQKGGVAGRNSGSVSDCFYLGMGSGDVINAVGVGTGSVSNCTPLYKLEGLDSETLGTVEVTNVVSDGTIYGGCYHAAGSELTLTLTATEKEDYTISGYYYRDGNNDKVPLSGNGTYTLTMPQTDVTIEAQYSYTKLAEMTKDDQGRYLVKTMDDLRAVAKASLEDDLNGCAGMTFLLDNDIENAGDFSGIAVTPAGSTTNYAFYGTFDGGGHTISGLNIVSDVETVGFIGSLDEIYGTNDAGTLKNLTLKNCSVTNIYYGHGYVGMLVGNCHGGKLENCRVLGGSVMASSDQDPEAQGYIPSSAGAIVGTGTLASDSEDNYYDQKVGVFVDGEPQTPGKCGTGDPNDALAQALVITLADDDDNSSDIWTFRGVAAEDNGEGAGSRKNRGASDEGNDEGEEVVNVADAPEFLDKSFEVTLTGRTLYKDGKWNTLCLPFALSADEIATSPLAGADIRTLAGASFSDANGELTLNFTPESGEGAVSSIEAGKPYIIKWAEPAGYVAYNGENAETCSDIVSPVFQGVTLDATDRSVSFDLDDTEGQEKGITFSGTYDVMTFDAADPSFLYLGAENKLYYPSAARDFNPFRAYFQLDGLTAGEPDPVGGGESGQVNVRAFKLNFFDEETTNILSTTNFTNYTDKTNAWYDLSGRRLSGKPTKPGLYINNGRKVLVSDKR